MIYYNHQADVTRGASLPHTRRMEHVKRYGTPQGGLDTCRLTARNNVDLTCVVLLPTTR